MPKSQEHNILINLSLWANKRKAINKMIILGFEYPLFIFSLILTFIKPSFKTGPLLNSFPGSSIHMSPRPPTNV